MNKSLIGVSLAAAALAVAAAGLAQATEPLQPYPVKGQVIQRLKAFDNPEGAIFQRRRPVRVYLTTPLSWACPIRDSTGPTKPAISASSQCSPTAR